MKGRLEPRVERLEADAGRDDGAYSLNVVFVGVGETTPADLPASTMVVRFVEPVAAAHA